MALPVRSESKIIEAISIETGFTKGDVRVFLAALDDEIVDAIQKCERARFCGLTVEPVIKKATKKRMGRNPHTGEEVEIPAKKASSNVKVRVSKGLKEQAPSPQKILRNLA